MFKEIIKSIGIGVIFFSCAIGIGIGICSLESAIDASKWNNGICKYCDGDFEFSNASHSKWTTYYYYHCESCGYIIDTNSPQTKK